MNTETWFDKFFSEKRIDLEEEFVIEKNSCIHIMDYATVINAINHSPLHERKEIKKTLIKIDFANGDVCHYLAHLSQAFL